MENIDCHGVGADAITAAFNKLQKSEEGPPEDILGKFLGRFSLNLMSRAVYVYVWFIFSMCNLVN